MQQLKEQRMSPAEKFVLETIKGAKAGESNENGDVEWSKDGEWLFIQYFKYNTLWVRNKKIWSVLAKEYNLNHNEIQQLINNVMYKHTNNGQLKPHW